MADTNFIDKQTIIQAPWLNDVNAAVYRAAGVNVKSPAFGAVGDGITDDTAALQAAASLGRMIILPAGVYKTTSPIICLAGTSWRGEGSAKSVIFGSHSGRTLSYEDVNTYGVFIQDLEIRGNGASTGVYIASTLEQSSHLHMENVRIYNHAKGTDGVDTFALFDSYLEKVDFIACSTWGFQLGGSQNTLVGCTFRLCLWGVYQNSASGFSVGGGGFYGCTFIGNTFDIVNGANIVRPLRFDACWFEQTATYTVGKITSGEVFFTSLTFHGCLFQPAAAAGGTGVIDAFNYKGNVTFSNCIVYADLLAGATLPSLAAFAADNNVTYQRLGCSRVTGVGTNTPLSDILYSNGMEIADASGTKILTTPTGIGFFGGAAVAKPTVTGAKGGNVALTSLLAQLASLGLITDSTT